MRTSLPVRVPAVPLWRFDLHTSRAAASAGPFFLVSPASAPTSGSWWRQPCQMPARSRSSRGLLRNRRPPAVPARSHRRASNTSAVAAPRPIGGNRQGNGVLYAVLGSAPSEMPSWGAMPRRRGYGASANLLLEFSSSFRHIAVYMVRSAICIQSVWRMPKPI